MLPFVMAAYRSSSNQSTNYSPNYLMFAREGRAPADLVFGTQTEQAPTSYDDYSAAMESRMRQAYDLVGQELGVKAEWMKRHYDLRVRPQKFRTGEWVLYQGSYQGRQRKWERKYTPYLIIRELPPVNYLIQKSKRSRPIICHVDKLKKWTTDDPPKSWLTSNEQQPDDDNDPNFDTNSVDNTQPDQTTEKVITTTSEDIDSTQVKQIVESTFEPSIEGPPMLLSPEIRRQSSRRGNVRNEKSVVQSVTRIELFDD